MADEWSKPVKGSDGWFSQEALRGFEEPTVKLSPDGRMTIEGAAGSLGKYAESAPRDVVLRLLAAEASDRLGWGWHAGSVSHTAPLIMACKVGEWWFDDGTSGPGTPAEQPPMFRFRLVKGADGLLPYLTPDEVLAVQHGRYLLGDLLNREAGQ